MPHARPHADARDRLRIIGSRIGSSIRHLAWFLAWFPAWLLASTAATTATAAAPVAATPATATAAATARGTAWLPSITLRYDLRGHYLIDLSGSGSFLWVHDGGRYRVSLSGTSLIHFAYTSEGRIDGAWLAPDSYVEQVLTRRKVVTFDRAAGVLRFTAISGTMPLAAHLQDSASVFMQLAHELGRDPSLFAAGRHMAFVVARPSGTTTWDFTVVGRQTLRTGIGALDCWHLRHPASGGGLGAEVWLAPSLSDLPVQIRLNHDGDDFLLFTLRSVRRP